MSLPSTIQSFATIIPVNLSSVRKTFTLPAANTNQGRLLIFKDAFGFASTSSLALSTTGTDILERVSTTGVFLNTNYGAWTLTNDGLNRWFILDAYNSSLYLSFLPTQISGLQVWVDAADTSTVALSGSTVTSIRDKSRNAALFDQGSAKPTYGTWINGLNAMNFTTTTTGGIATTTTTPYNNIPQFTVFIVNRPTHVSGSLGYAAGIFGIRNATTTQISWHLQSDYSRFTAYNGSVIADTTTLTVARNEDNIFCIVQSASSFVYVKNGTTTSPVSITVTGRTGLPFNIGNSGSGSEAFIGNIGEVLFYSRPLAESERQRVEGYLSWKWGLQANLPANHPFRFVAP